MVASRRDGEPPRARALARPTRHLPPSRDGPRPRDDRAATRRAGSAVRFVELFLAGYLLAWSEFSAVAALAQWGLYRSGLLGPAPRPVLYRVLLHAVKSASIELDHAPARERIEVPSYLIVRTRENVQHDFIVSCGIPGHDHPG